MQWCFLVNGAGHMKVGMLDLLKINDEKLGTLLTTRTNFPLVCHSSQQRPQEPQEPGIFINAIFSV